MRFHIVRHGQTHWNVERRIQGQLDSELDELGIEQARQRGKDFVDLPLSAVYSSSSVRTRQTTENILGERTDPVVYMDELREVCWGIWEGHLWSDIEAAYPDMVEAHTKASDKFNVEGAESSYQTQQRGLAAIESIVKRQEASSQHSDSDEILIVSHGAIMKKILAHYIGVPLTSLYKLPPLPNCAHCIVDISKKQRTVMQIAGVSVEHTEWQRFSNSS